MLIRDIQARGVSCSGARVAITSDLIQATYKSLGGQRARYRNKAGWACTYRFTKVQLEGAPKGVTIDGPSYVTCRKARASVKYIAGFPDS